MSPELSFVDEDWMRGQTLDDFMGEAPPVLHSQAPARSCPICLIPRSEYEGHWCGPEWKRWT